MEKRGTSRSAKSRGIDGGRDLGPPGNKISEVPDRSHDPSRAHPLRLSFGGHTGELEFGPGMNQLSHYISRF